jgi:YVTN family beta-propeller protein
MTRGFDLGGVMLAACVAIGGLLVSAQSASAATPSLYSFTVAVGDSKSTANAVLFDGQFFWVAVQGRGGGTLKKLTTTGALLASAPVGVSPIEMAYDGVDIWVTNYDSSSISIVDANANLIKTIFLPAGAHPEGIFFDGKYMWIANNGVGENSVSKFEVASKTLLATYPVGLTPDSVAYDGTDIWVTNSLSDNVMKLDRETGEVLRTYPTGEYPLSIIFDGSSMWIGNGDTANSELPPLTTASVTRLRAAGGVNLGAFAAGNGVRGLAYDGTLIWTCNSIDNTFTRIRTSDGAPMGTYPTGKAPRAMAFDGVHMWIANSGENTVTIVGATPEPILIRPSIGFYIPAVQVSPKLLTPVAGGAVALQQGFNSITPRASPSSAAMGGILDALLDNN